MKSILCFKHDLEQYNCDAVSKKLPLILFPKMESSGPIGL